MGRLEKNHGKKNKTEEKKQAVAMDEVLGKNARKAIKADKKVVKNNDRKGKKKKKKAKLLTKVLMALLILFILVGGGTFAYQFVNSGFISNIMPFVPATQKFNDGEATILMLGSDARELNEASRSDTILVGRFNFKEGYLRVISIPRDTLVKIPGYKDTKINAAYALGGVELTEKTIEKLYGIEIDRTMEINFVTFQDTVEKLGGVEVIMDKPLYNSDWGLDLKTGSNILNGEVALNFVRFRGTPTADLGRIGRQQLFLKSLASDIKNKANIFEQADIIGGIFSDLKTNVTLNELFYMFNSYKKLNDFKITTWMSSGETKTIEDGSYVIPSTGIAKMAQGFLDGSLVVTAEHEGGIFPELVTLKEKAETDRKAAEAAAKSNTTLARAEARKTKK